MLATVSNVAKNPFPALTFVIKHRKIMFYKNLLQYSLRIIMDFKREKYIFSSYDCVGKKRKYLFVLYFYSILCFLSNYQKYFEQTVF